MSERPSSAGASPAGTSSPGASSGAGSTETSSAGASSSAASTTAAESLPSSLADSWPSGDTERSSPERHERGEFGGARKRRTGPYSADECGAPPPSDLLKGIHEFNAGEFFEQHETLETLWRATDGDVRYLYQGILLVGVGFYHLGRGNYHGAQAKLAAGIVMLDWFAPACQTVDVADLIARARPCLEQVRTLGKERLANFDRALIPQIRLLS